MTPAKAKTPRQEQRDRPEQARPWPGPTNEELEDEFWDTAFSNSFQDATVLHAKIAVLDAAAERGFPVSRSGLLFQDRLPMADQMIIELLAECMV